MAEFYGSCVFKVFKEKLTDRYPNISVPIHIFTNSVSKSQLFYILTNTWYDQCF